MTSTTEIIVPGLFRAVPGDWRSGIEGLERLERMLSRADPEPEREDDVERLLCGRFGLSLPDTEDVPTGALAFRGDGGDPGDGFWLRAHPVHLVADRDRVMLFPAKEPEMTSDKTKARAELFNRHFDADGWYLETPHPMRWYLRSPRALRLVTWPLQAVTGRSVDAYLPQGPDARLLRRVVAETEMLFHAVDTRVSDGHFGSPAANGIWLCGAGRLPQVLTAPAKRLRAGDPLARGLALCAGMPIVSSDEALEETAGTLIYERGLQQALSNDDREAYRAAFGRLVGRLSKAADSLAAGTLDGVRIGDGQGRLWTSTRATQRRWWRKRRLFESFCEESV